MHGTISATTTCACCGQALPPPPSIFDALRLSWMQRRICERVRAAGAHGVSGVALLDLLYGHDVNGGPLSGIAVIRAIIARANSEQLVKIGKVVRAEKGGRGSGAGARPYVLRDLP